MFIVRFREFILAGNATSAECVASALEWNGHRMSLSGGDAFRRWNRVAGMSGCWDAVKRRHYVAPEFPVLYE